MFFLTCKVLNTLFETWWKRVTKRLSNSVCTFQNFRAIPISHLTSRRNALEGSKYDFWDLWWKRVTKSLSNSVGTFENFRTIPIYPLTPHRNVLEGSKYDFWDPWGKKVLQKVGNWKIGATFFAYKKNKGLSFSISKTKNVVQWKLKVSFFLVLQELDPQVFITKLCFGENRCMLKQNTFRSFYNLQLNPIFSCFCSNRRF